MWACNGMAQVVQWLVQFALAKEAMQPLVNEHLASSSAFVLLPSFLACIRSGRSIVRCLILFWDCFCPLHSLLD